MTSEDLISAVVARSVHNTNTVRGVLYLVIDEILREIERGGGITISGFGSLKASERSDKRIIRFRPGISLRKAVSKH